MIRQFMLGYAGNLVFYPPEGLPDGNVSLSLFTKEGEAWGDGTNPITLTVDTATEDTTAQSEIGSDVLTVASTSGFVVGKRYLVVLDDGYWFEVKLRAVGTTTLTLDEGVPVVVPIGAAIKGWSFTHALTALELDVVRRDIKALYVYAVGGESIQHIERFDCVREPFRIAITVKHIREKAADFADFAGASQRWKSYVDGAHSEVDEIIRAHGIYPDRIQNREALRSALVNSILVKFHAPSQNPMAEVYRGAMNDCIQRALTQNNAYDANDSGTSSDDDGETSRIPGGRTFMFI